MYKLKLENFTKSKMRFRLHIHRNYVFQLHDNLFDYVIHQMALKRPSVKMKKPRILIFNREAFRLRLGRDGKRSTFIYNKHLY